MFLVLINNILKVNNLTTGPQMYAIKKNFMVGESLQFLEQKSWAYGRETIKNYKLFF